MSITSKATPPVAEGVLTVEDIAEFTSIPYWRINYALRSRGIQHHRVINGARVWLAKDFPQIIDAINAVGSK